MSDGSSARVLKGGHFTLEGVNWPHDALTFLVVLLAERCTLMAKEGVHDGTLFWHFHFWITAQIAFVDVVNQLINAVDMVNERDNDWVFLQCRILSHCISNVGHVLHLLKIEPYVHHPTIIGFGNILFGMLIHYSDPEGVSLAGDAVGPIAKDVPAVGGGSLGVPLLHNSSNELRDDVMHCLFNSMNGFVWEDFGVLPLLPFSDDAL